MQPETDADDFLQRDPKSGEYVLNKSVTNFGEVVKKERAIIDSNKGKGGSSKPLHGKKGHDTGGHVSKAVAASVAC